MIKAKVRTLTRKRRHTIEQAVFGATKKESPSGNSLLNLASARFYRRILAVKKSLKIASRALSGGGSTGSTTLRETEMTSDNGIGVFNNAKFHS